MMLVSDSYRAMLQSYHADNPDWGASSMRYAGHVRDLAQRTGSKTILDYGSGKGALADSLKEYEVSRYDPGMPEISGMPDKADMVVCTDVLEHIEPECLDAVLVHILSLSLRCGYLAICTIKTAHILPDGRNAHLIVNNQHWWKQKLIEIGFESPRATPLTGYAPMYCCEYLIDD